MVTGGAGFLGGHVVAELLAAGHEVVVFDCVTACGERVRGASMVLGDLLDLPQLTTATQRIDGICHLGGVDDFYVEGLQELFNEVGSTP